MVPTIESLVREQEVHQIYIKGVVYEMVKITQAIKAAQKSVKLHCIEQAKIIVEKVEMKLYCDTPETEYICKDSILNAYSLDLIK